MGGPFEERQALDNYQFSKTGNLFSLTNFFSHSLSYFFIDTKTQILFCWHAEENPRLSLFNHFVYTIEIFVQWKVEVQGTVDLLALLCGQ